MRKNRSASGCSAFIRWYCCIAGVAVGEAAGTPQYTGSRAAVRPLAPGEARLLSSRALRVIAVDTSSERSSVALVEGGEIRGEVRLATSVPSIAVVPAVELILRSLGLAASDVEGFAVTLGPGSFTGVRVGLSTVQGLALGSGRPCVGLSTLDVLAAGIAGEADSLVVLADAFRDEVFVGRYDRNARALAPPSRERPDAVLASLPAESVLTGDGARRYESLVRAALPRARIAQPDAFLAGRLGRLAEPRLEKGEGVSAADLRPLYLRDADVRPSRP